MSRILELELEVKQLRDVLDFYASRVEGNNRAAEFLDRAEIPALAEAYVRLRDLLQGDSWSHVRVKATLAEIKRLEK